MRMKALVFWRQTVQDAIKLSWINDLQFFWKPGSLENQRITLLSIHDTKFVSTIKKNYSRHMLLALLLATFVLWSQWLRSFCIHWLKYTDSNSSTWTSVQLPIMNTTCRLEQVLLVEKNTWTKTTGTFYIIGIKYLVKYFYSKISTSAYVSTLILSTLIIAHRLIYTYEFHSIASWKSRQI